MFICSVIRLQKRRIFYQNLISIKMDPPDENAGDEPAPNIRRKRNLTGGQIKQIISQLLLLVKECDEQHYLKHSCINLFYCKDALFSALFFK